MLDLPTRRRIVAYVGDHPGTSARGVQRGIGLGWGETAYHLRRLVAAGELARDRDGRRDFYFPPAFDAEDRRLLRAMRGEVPRRILLALTVPEGRSFHALVEGLDIARSTIAFHLRILLLTGEVERDPGTVPRYRARAPDRVSALARRYPIGPPDLEERFSESFGGLVRD